MIRDPNTPPVAELLGWLGVLPFAAFAAMSVVGGVIPAATALNALILYAAVILAFMGGAQWGLTMTDAAPDPRTQGIRYTVSVLPALAGFAATFLPSTLSLGALTASFLALLLYDVATVRKGMAPTWYPGLRARLTGAVVLCLMAAAFLGGR